ncbi:hypothetical protein Tco_0841167 [Tanacetum coccineum]|uniref:Uncharacterized protein n=1 Tax=Tanacetum coccineum TaxID=301880 RepID=A0ABQ5AVV9_9ASTR
MNQNNEDRQLFVFEIDANDDETDVVFLEQAYAYHQQLGLSEEKSSTSLPELSNRNREGRERVMSDYFNVHCKLTPMLRVRDEFSVIMKCNSGLRQLAYGANSPMSLMMEYLQMNVEECLEEH